jgi:protein TonB
MHTIQPASNMSISEINKVNSPFFRFAMSIVIGGFITFVLFASMHELIKQDGQRIVEVETIPVFPVIFVEPEEKTNHITRIKPQPKVEVLPTTPQELPAQTTDTSTFTNVISIPKVATGKLAFDIKAVDQQPRPLVRIDPRYPAIAASNGIEGFVTLAFGVSASGEVVDVQVIESEPKRTFDQAAKKALRKWRYQPKMLSGSPVPMEGLQVRLDFTLAKD